MVTKCYAAGCNYGTRAYDGPKRAVFRFPKDPARRSLWIAACRRADSVPGRFSALCSAHFEDHLIRRREKLNPDGSVDAPKKKGNGPVLSEDAVPSIFFSDPVGVRRCGGGLPNKRRLPDDQEFNVDEVLVKSYLPAACIRKRTHRFRVFFENDCVGRRINVDDSGFGDDLLVKLRGRISELLNSPQDFAIAWTDNRNREVVCDHDSHLRTAISESPSSMTGIIEVHVKPKNAVRPRILRIPPRVCPSVNVEPKIHLPLSISSSQESRAQYSPSRSRMIKTESEEYVPMLHMEPKITIKTESGTFAARARKRKSTPVKISAMRSPESQSFTPSEMFDDELARSDFSL